VVFLLFALAAVAGDLLRDALRAWGFITPRFLTAMVAGVAISIAADLTRLPMARDVIERCGDICLSLFIVMALCGVDLSALGRLAGPMVLVAAAQSIGIVLFAHFLVFRPMLAANAYRLRCECNMVPLRHSPPRFLIVTVGSQYVARGGSLNFLHFVTELSRPIWMIN